MTVPPTCNPRLIDTRSIVLLQKTTNELAQWKCAFATSLSLLGATNTQGGCRPVCARFPTGHEQQSNSAYQASERHLMANRQSLAATVVVPVLLPMVSVTGTALVEPVSLTGVPAACTA